MIASATWEFSVFFISVVLVPFAFMWAIYRVLNG